VRLALFAEMVKGKPWTPATLRQVGGSEGVGVAFLEETFSAATAPPPHRLHQKAARAVLKALLPDPGADLKGHMRSHQELQDAAGYAGRPQDFADLMHILDTELRLVTPTDPEGAFEEGPTAAARAASPSYQLTHDYLVPALRQWLTRKQRETRQGRMELLLAERVSLWSVKQDSRQLPGWWEWLNILLWTRPGNWTPPQRRMLRAATRRHLLQAAVLLLAATVFGWALWEVYRGPVKADHLVRALASADIEGVDKIIDEMAACRPWAEPKLRALIEDPPSAKARLHASLALLPDSRQVAYLEEQLLKVGPDEAWVIVQHLRRTDHQLKVASWLRTRLETTSMQPGHRLRAACALAFLQPGEHWERWSDEVVDALVKQDLATAQKWIRLPMEGSGTVLFGSMKRAFLNPHRPESERSLAAALARYSFVTYNLSSAKELMEFVLAIDGEPYRLLNEWFIASGQEAATLLNHELDTKNPAGRTTVDDLARRQAHAAVVLLQLEDWDKRGGPLDPKPQIRADRLWPLLRDSPDPRLHSLRSYLIDRFARADVNADELLARYAAEEDVSARRALLLALGEFKDYQLPADSRMPLVKRLRRDYCEDPDPGIHSAAGWLLRQWKHRGSVEEIDRALATGKVEEKRRWYVTAQQGHTLAVIPSPAKVTMGSPEGEPGRHPEEKQHRRDIPYSFAVTTEEVRVRQFRKFLSETKGVIHDWGPTMRYSPDGESDDGPVLGVTWFAAVQYCRWLSQQEGIREEEWCYPSIPEIKDGMPLPADFLARTGYRLPTEAEWEYACRAGAVTSRPYGSADALLDRYARYDRNSHSRAARVGSLKPNDLGMFDMLGNAWEWCHDAMAPCPAGPEHREPPGRVRAAEPRVLRGGGFFSAAPELRAAHRIESPPQATRSEAGFRVARTMPR
jgi:formylglycine-generating enzyme required for sulfatase activity